MLHVLATSERSGIGALGGILVIVGLWFIFKKAGRPGWAAIVPFYNAYTLFNVAWGQPWLFLLLLVPLVNVVVYILCLVKLAHAFGEGGGFAVGLLLLPFIFFPILAFGGSRYLGPQY